MIIAPAILVSNMEDFEKQLALYTEFAECIDIDINVEADKFRGIVTVDIESVLKKITSGSVHYPVCNYHLMVTFPKKYVEMIYQYDVTFNRIYLHQEADLEDIEITDKIGITVKAETPMREIEYYKQFSEVQLMTIETGAQGNPIKPEILERSRWLRNNGYEGEISIDGGTNDKTAELIKQYPIDKVSVGSFFSRANDPKSNYEKLQQLLN